MNYKMIASIIGKIMVIMAAFMLLPLSITLICYEDEGIRNVLAFLIPMVSLFIIGFSS